MCNPELNPVYHWEAGVQNKIRDKYHCFRPMTSRGIKKINPTSRRAFLLWGWFRINNFPLIFDKIRRSGTVLFVKVINLVDYHQLRFPSTSSSSLEEPRDDSHLISLPHDCIDSPKIDAFGRPKKMSLFIRLLQIKDYIYRESRRVFICCSSAFSYSIATLKSQVFVDLPPFGFLKGWRNIPSQLHGNHFVVTSCLAYAARTWFLTVLLTLYFSCSFPLPLDAVPIYFTGTLQLIPCDCDICHFRNCEIAILDNKKVRKQLFLTILDNYNPIKMYPGLFLRVITTLQDSPYSTCSMQLNKALWSHLSIS